MYRLLDKHGDKVLQILEFLANNVNNPEPIDYMAAPFMLTGGGIS